MEVKADKKPSHKLKRVLAGVLTAVMLALGVVTFAPAPAHAWTATSGGLIGAVYPNKLNAGVDFSFGCSFGCRYIDTGGSMRVDRSDGLPAMTTQYAKTTLTVGKWNPTARRWEYAGGATTSDTLRIGTKYIYVPRMKTLVGALNSSPAGYYTAWINVEWQYANGVTAGYTTVSYQNGAADYDCFPATYYGVWCGHDAKYVYF